MEWKEVRLGEVADVQTGPFGSQLHKENYVNKGTPIVTVEHLGNKWFTSQNLPMVSDEDKLRLAKYCSQEGDVLFSRVGSVDRCSYVSKEYSGWLFSGRCLRVRPRSGINPEYLYYFLTNEGTKQYIRNIAVGATMPSINTKLLNEVPITIPSLDDQRRIASILSSLDRKIELNNKINADLEEMAQAIFKNWFLDFKPFKDSKFEDSELGMIPEGWKVGRLTDVIKLMPGGTPKTSEPLYWDNGTIPFFSPKDVNGVYCFATEKHITEAGLNKCSSNLYPKDTIFITCRGTVGKVCLVACDMAMNQSNYAIKAIDGYSQYYVFFLVKSVVERLIKKSNGAVFSAITSKDFDEEILIPSQKAVEDFTNVIDGFFRRIFTIGTENSRLSTLRDTLLPRLMSGELEVPE